MFLVSYEILSRYRFQLHVRRYVHDIFKIGLGAFSKAIGEAIGECIEMFALVQTIKMQKRRDTLF